MAEYVNGPTKSFEADGAIALHARVSFDADGKVTAAGLTTKEIGTAETEAFAAGDIITVRLTSAPGTCKMIAAEALSVGDAVHTAASGKVGDTATATGYLVGRSLTISGADGDIIEVLRNSHGDTANA